MSWQQIRQHVNEEMCHLLGRAVEGVESVLSSLELKLAEVEAKLSDKMDRCQTTLDKLEWMKRVRESFARKIMPFLIFQAQVDKKTVEAGIFQERAMLAVGKFNRLKDKIDQVSVLHCEFIAVSD